MLERRGDAIRFHPTLLGFAGAYRYEPRPVAIARGNEKGRVERAIRYVRDAFFAARTFTVRNAAGPTPQNYETLHQRLVAAAEAHPFLPRPFFRSKRTQT